MSVIFSCSLHCSWCPLYLFSDLSLLSPLVSFPCLLSCSLLFIFLYCPLYCHTFSFQRNPCNHTFSQTLQMFHPLPSFLYTRARICRPFEEPRNRFPAWRAGSTALLFVRPARLHRLAELIPQNRFQGSINVYKYGLCAERWWVRMDGAVDPVQNGYFMLFAQIFFYRILAPFSNSKHWTWFG